MWRRPAAHDALRGRTLTAYPQQEMVVAEGVGRASRSAWGRGPISRPTRACAREAEAIAPAHSSRTAATGPDYGSAGRPPHIFGVPGPPAPIIAPVSLMSEKSKRNLVKPRSRPFRSGWSPPSAGLSGSRGFSRAAIRACRRLRPEVGREAVRNEGAGAMVSASRAHARVGREIGPRL